MNNSRKLNEIQKHEHNHPCTQQIPVKGCHRHTAEMFLESTLSNQHLCGFLKLSQAQCITPVFMALQLLLMWGSSFTQVQTPPFTQGTWIFTCERARAWGQPSGGGPKHKTGSGFNLNPAQRDSYLIVVCTYDIRLCDANEQLKGYLMHTTETNTDQLLAS